LRYDAAVYGAHFTPRAVKVCVVEMLRRYFAGSGGAFFVSFFTPL